MATSKKAVKNARTAVARPASKKAARPVKKEAPKKAAPRKPVPAKKAVKPAAKSAVATAKPVAAKKAVPVKKPVEKTPLKSSTEKAKAPVTGKAGVSTEKAPAKAIAGKPLLAKAGNGKSVSEKLSVVNFSADGKAVSANKVTLAKSIDKANGKSGSVAAKTSVDKTEAAKAVVTKADSKPVNVKFAEIRKAAREQVRAAEAKKEVKPVVLPKLSTSAARKYEPDFTRSILDQPETQQSGPTMRYSDAELVEFKELILRKLESAKKELAYLQGLITRKDEMGGDESENRYMTMEDGSISMEREQLSQMASRQITYIDHLEKALMRIENKTYGICRVTGKLIDKARLRAVPHATLSIEAKMGTVKNPNAQ